MIHYQLNLVQLAALTTWRSSNKFYEQQTHTILQNVEPMNHPETHNYDKTNPNISSQVRVKLNSNRFSKHSGNPFLSTGRSDTLIPINLTLSEASNSQLNVSSSDFKRYQPRVSINARYSSC